MPHHFTKATVQAECWCKPCGKYTQWTVYNGRRGACLECIARREKEAKDRPVQKPAAEQGRLF
jgi:hypothetical protein